MGVATVTAYTDTKREAVEIEKDAGAVLVEAGAKIDKVNVIELNEGRYNSWVAKIQFLGDMTAVLKEAKLEDLACEIWTKVGDYCWLHIAINQGDEQVQEKFARSDYQELMG